MAQKVLVTLVDDLDGTTGTDIATVLFGLDGVEYEIDLTEDNSDALRDVLADYIASARRTGGRYRRPSGGNTKDAAKGTVVGAVKSSRPKEELRAIRQWGRGNGYADLAERGRIPQAVLDDYDKAHAPDNPRKGRRR